MFPDLAGDMRQYKLAGLKLYPELGIGQCFCNLSFQLNNIL